jgi:hypothetical protein
MAPAASLPTAQLKKEEFSFYRHLDEERNEIRLISIFPEPTIDSPSIICCSIKQVSLLDFCVPYEEFLSISPAHSRPRKILHDWKTAKCGKTAPQAGSYIDPPDSILHRYTWGDYETLSYVWGNPNDRSVIMINGEEVSVTLNLEKALRSIQTRHRFEGPYHLWVDAICINQEDKVEVGSQVKKMQQIFGNSFASVAWLGEEGSEGKQALDLLKKLESFQNPRDEYRARSLATSLKADPSYLGIGCWDALCSFLGRDYWSRIWVMQEIVLSSSDMVIYCGTLSITWPQFCDGLSFVHEYLWMIKDTCLLNDRQDRKGPWWPTKNMHKLAKDLYPACQLVGNKQTHLRLSRLIDLAATSESSFRRDKVYGVLALMDDKLARRIVPDYTTEDDSVFITVAKAYVSEYQNLELLRHGGIWGGRGTPSWVPDWFWRIGRIREDPLKKDYNASGSLRMSVLFLDTPPERLICAGIVVDTVEGIGAAHIPYGEWLPQSVVQSASARSAYSSIDTLDGTRDALARTLYGDRSSDGDIWRSSNQRLFSLPADDVKARRLFRELHWASFAHETWTNSLWSQWRAANADFLIGGRRFDDYFEHEALTSGDEIDVWEAYRSWIRIHHGKRLMTTQNGYIGWVPDKRDPNTTGQVVPGDVIAIVYGCSRPLVLRDLGDAYQVIGEAYLQGLMEGEVAGLLASGALKAKSLVLC